MKAHLVSTYPPEAWLGRTHYTIFCKCGWRSSERTTDRNRAMAVAYGHAHEALGAS